MASIYEALVKGGILQSKVKEEKKNSEEQLEEMQKCFRDHHTGYVGHVVQDCEEFRNIIQALMDKKEIEFSEKIKEKFVNVIVGEGYSNTSSSRGPKALTIYYEDELKVARRPTVEISMPKLKVEVPSSFSYKSNKVVPWKYNCNYINETTATDLTGVGGITWSGRCYSPIMTEEVVQKKVTKPIEAGHLFKGKKS